MSAPAWKVHEAPWAFAGHLQQAVRAKPLYLRSQIIGRIKVRLKSFLRVFTATSIAVAWAMTGSAAGQNYPERPITLVVGLAPGGSSDTVAREIARGLGENLGVNVVVENRPGANTMIASAYVAQANPDGYTLLVSSSMNATNPWIYEELGYDYETDLRHVALLGVAPNLMALSASSPINSLADLIEYSKTNPGGFSYGSAGIGSVHHLLLELIAHQFEIEMTHVPYTGGGPAIQDVVGGHIDSYFGTISSTNSFIESGDLKPLFVTSAERSRFMPDVETMEENGITGVNSDYWLGLAAPSGVSDEIVERLNRAINEVLTNAEVVERLERQFIEPAGGTVEDMEQFFAQEMALWESAADAAGMKKD